MSLQISQNPLIIIFLHVKTCYRIKNREWEIEKFYIISKNKYMKKALLILIILLLNTYCLAQTLTGGINYSVNDARVEVQNTKPPAINFLLVQDNFNDINHKENYSKLLKGETDLKDRTLGLFSDGSYAINYKNSPKYVWYYDKNGELINTEQKTSLQYPYKTYKYTPDGELVNMTLRVSKTETFIFSPLGELLGHWVGQNCYDEKGNIVMTRKILE